MGPGDNRKWCSFFVCRWRLSDSHIYIYIYIYNLAKVKLSLVGSLAMLALVVRVNQDSAWPLCSYTVRLMLVVLVSQSALDWREKRTTSHPMLTLASAASLIKTIRCFSGLADIGRPHCATPGNWHWHGIALSLPSCFCASLCCSIRLLRLRRCCTASCVFE